MGGKKKGKKRGKGKGKKGITDDATTEEKNWILQAEKEALEQKLILIIQQSNHAKSAMQEAKHHYLQSEDAAKSKEKRSQDIVSDMTRQYKSTEDELQQ